MDFSDALRKVKNGKLLARQGWNGRALGKGMFIYLVGGSTFKDLRPPLTTIFLEGTEIVYQPHIDLRTAQGDCVPWTVSQTDMLSGDWEIVDELGELIEPADGTLAPNTKSMMEEDGIKPPHAPTEEEANASLEDR